MVRGERAWVPVTDKIPRPWPHSPWQLVTVVLGAHDLQSQEPEQQKFTIVQVFQNNYNHEENLNDVLLIQVGRPRGRHREHEGVSVSASAPAVLPVWCAWLVAAVRVRVEATFWLLLGPWLFLLLYLSLLRFSSNLFSPSTTCMYSFYCLATYPSAPYWTYQVF